ncbi:MAG: hypothetical protein HZB26_13240 [Candidatus Hydrogenedentes bacterium]|nr:hypothetical protein [Candidatus Hydrogenedentota bacterium]
MKTKSWTDPVVEEVRQWRGDLFREAGNDLKRLGDRIMETQGRHGAKLVRRAPKTVGTTGK